MPNLNLVTAFPRAIYVFCLCWAAGLEARLREEDKKKNSDWVPAIVSPTTLRPIEEEDKKANSDWVPAIVSPTTLRPIEVDRGNIKRGLDCAQATTAVDIARRFPVQQYDGAEPPRLATTAELKEIFRQCGNNLPVHSPKTAWLSSTRGVGPRVGGGLEYDGSVLTVNFATRQAEWHGPDDGHQDYGVIFVRDQRIPS
jgi:hypothetical protein